MTQKVKGIIKESYIFYIRSTQMVFFVILGNKISSKFAAKTVKIKTADEIMSDFSADLGENAKIWY